MNNFLLFRSPNSFGTTSSGGLVDIPSDCQSQSPFPASYSLSSPVSPVNIPPINRSQKSGCESRYCDSCNPPTKYEQDSNDCFSNSFRSSRTQMMKSGGFGNNCLHAAVEENNLQAVLNLIHHNFDVFQTNRNHETPEDLAHKKNNVAIKAILELSGKLQQKTKQCDSQGNDLFNLRYELNQLQRVLNQLSQENKALKEVIQDQQNDRRDLRTVSEIVDNSRQPMGSERSYSFRPSQWSSNPEELVFANPNRGNYSNNNNNSSKRSSAPAQVKEILVDEGYPSSGELREQDTRSRRTFSTSESRRSAKNSAAEMGAPHGIYQL